MKSDSEQRLGDMPPDALCTECDFDWQVGHEEAMVLVLGCTTRAAAAVSRPERRTTPGCWGPSAYVWHLADVVRVSAERIFGASVAPGVPVVPFDPDELAAARNYTGQRADVGVQSLDWSVRSWHDAVTGVSPQTRYVHPELGAMTVGGAVLLVAHEVHHHLIDMGLRDS